MVVPFHEVVIIGAILMAGYFVARGFFRWWFEANPKTLDKFHLTEKCYGMVLFGLDGSYIALQSELSTTTIRLKKIFRKEGEVFIQLDVKGPHVSDSVLNEIRARIELVSDGECNLSRNGEDHLSGEIMGPVPNDHLAIESVLRTVVSSLGFRPDAKFKIEFEGPANNQAVADFYDLKGGSKDD